MNNKFKVAFFSSQKYDREAFKRSLPIDMEVEFFDAKLSSKTVNLASGFSAVCCFVNDNLDRETLIKLNELNINFIALRCAGFNNVDLKAAKELGVQVARVPAYSPEAVAEHCMSLILTLSRKTHKAYNRVKENNFDLNGLLGFNIHRKTIGVIGLGKIGKAFLRIANGFGATVIFHDPYESSSDGEKVSLEELFLRSDIIALHCPLNESTHHIIDENSLKMMKDGVMIINTSRGGLLDTKACISGLKAKKIGFLGLDVYEQESELFFQDLSCEIVEDDLFQRLLTFPNVLITGHQGFFTKEALAEIVDTTYLNIRKYRDQDTNPNLVE